ncbi:MAG: phosphate/phosphite/phosphonate ABC transporter substrate-binding protein, partial [Desulfobulbaceae bacterium]|nr:phosphate/phosphite/phosphonate ABC transporter substrate-binding protein [Desulfobulbaceae bacterium]
MKELKEVHNLAVRFSQIPSIRFQTQTVRTVLFLFAFLLCAAISSAHDPGSSENDIYLKNSAIIKEVHARGGLVFAVPPYWGPMQTQIGFEQLAGYLGEVTGKEVRLVVLKDHEAMITRTVAGEVDLGFYGSSVYITTKEKYPGLRYLGSSIWKKTGKSSYYSYLITRKGSGLLSLAGLKEKSFAFGSRESTGGYKYPRAWMKENGLEPKKYFKSVRFLERHDIVLSAIAEGRVDAGVVSPGTLDKATEKYGDIYNRIHKFGPIPSSLLSAGHTLPLETARKI